MSSILSVMARNSWALIVSCSVFAIGGGVTVAEGIRAVMKPEPVKGLGWSFLALGCGVAFDAGSLIFSVRKFQKENQGKGFREAVAEVKDPTPVMVMAEDSAAIVGEFIAAAGIGVQALGWRYGDGVASVLIGFLLGAVAVFLISQNRDLIIGESVDDEISRAITEIAARDGRFTHVRSARTIHFGPDAVLVTLEAEFDPERKARELIDTVDAIQREIRERYPSVRFIFVDPETAKPEEDAGSGPSALKKAG